ncbi:PREDICTED: uncharacterized protein LOC109188834 [Ipomoea nil]|uniref:uncharacterized protein LOC109188834 n=1 Tax=Ipomoea nil TaxID=35883 RepID=UPI000901179D|nr:PREDICTED: uncharacterized protein LOC109188834 [Ipomoea nil]
MEQPPGFIDSTQPNYICKLKKALYGLKQAPRAWYLELSYFLINFGFKKTISDASLFVYAARGMLVYFMVYVDDIIVTGNNDVFLDRFIKLLSQKFALKDLGTLHHFLGVEVVPISGGYFLSQSRYVADILARYNMDGAKPVSTPMSTMTSVSIHEGEPVVDVTDFRRLIGMLQYLSVTRPDVAYVVNSLSQCMHSPKAYHWGVVKRLLRYMKDSDWGGSRDDGRSTTGFVICLGSNVVSWKSVRQKTVSRSSTDAEYRALASSAAEVIWVQNLFSNFLIAQSFH